MTTTKTGIKIPSYVIHSRHSIFAPYSVFKAIKKLSCHSCSFLVVQVNTENYVEDMCEAYTFISQLKPFKRIFRTEFNTKSQSTLLNTIIHYQK